MIVVLSHRVRDGWRDAREVRREQRHEARRRCLHLSQHQCSDREVHHANRRFLPALPVLAQVRRVVVHPVLQPGIESRDRARVVIGRLLREVNHPVEAGGLPQRLDIAHRGIEIPKRPPQRIRGLRALSGERVAMPVGDTVPAWRVPTEGAADGARHRACHPWRTAGDRREEGSPGRTDGNALHGMDAGAQAQPVARHARDIR